MPVQITTKTGGAEYDGTAGSGLLDPGYLGSERNRVVIRSVAFTTSSTIGTWTLTVQRLNGTTVETVAILAYGTSTTFALFGGVGGYYVLPAVNGTSYRLSFSTTVVTGDSMLTIDWDVFQGGSP
jgi:hypothetical protein